MNTLYISLLMQSFLQSLEGDIKLLSRLLYWGKTASKGSTIGRKAVKIKREQAGAELCQAQLRLKLAS